MADFTIDFEWPRSSYELKPPTKPRPLNTAAIEDIDWVMGDGFKREVATGERFGLIVARGAIKNVRHEKRALDAAVSALLGLAATSPKDLGAQTSVLTMAKALGMLRSESEPGKTETVYEWYMLAVALRSMFEMKKHPTAFEKTNQVGKLGVFLNINSKGGPPTLAFQPTNLSDAIVLHAARSIAAGASHQTCEFCKGLFMSGGVRGAGSKRAGARFCSDKCRADYHNAKLRKS